MFVSLIRLMIVLSSATCLLLSYLRLPTRVFAWSPGIHSRAHAKDASPGVRAQPDFSGGTDWFNVSRPLVAEDVRGRVVLLDFWTFCCINCIHVIPELKRLEEHFGDKLVVIGVHSGKFENEKRQDEIAKAIARYGIQHPVVNDPDFEIWRRFGAQGWPTFVVLDERGERVFQQSGEMSFENLKKVIELALVKNETRGRGKNHLTPSGLKQLPLAVSKRAYGTGPLNFNAKITAGPKSLFLANSGKNQILELDFKGKPLRSLGTGAPGFVDGRAQVAQFRNPQGACLLSPGELVVADTDNHAVRLVELKSGEVSTILSEGRSVGGAMGRRAVRSPWAVECVGDTIYVAMAGRHQLGKLLKKGANGAWEYEVFAGTGGEDIKDGHRLSAELAQPSALRFDKKRSRLYFLDSETSALRYVDLSTNRVVSLVGMGLFEFGMRDGDRITARMQHPLDFALAENGDLIIADSYNHTLRRFDVAKSRLTTIESSVALSEPAGIAFLGKEILVSSTNAHAIFLGSLEDKRASLRPFGKLNPGSESKARPFFPNAKEGLKPEFTLIAGDPISVQFAVELPRGEKFNEQFPATASLLTADGQTLEKVGWLPWLSMPLGFVVPRIAQGSQVEFAVTFAHCAAENPTECKLASMIWQVKVEPAGPQRKGASARGKPGQNQSLSLKGKLDQK